MRELRSNRDLEATVITFRLAVVGSYAESLAGRLKGCFSFLVGITKFVETLSTGPFSGRFQIFGENYIGGHVIIC